jgi:hypothetical protein
MSNTRKKARQIKSHVGVANKVLLPDGYSLGMFPYKPPPAPPAEEQQGN